MICIFCIKKIVTNTLRIHKNYVYLFVPIDFLSLSYKKFVKTK